jgi:16S rRNA A1518/A1519 N6-dimethyltransferase RsmA/KsgA/DIM1 with predicted DNA glycosylase/AP lyase activity
MIVLVLIGLVLLFGFVLLFGPPYLPTRRQQITTALDLLDLKPGQTLLELGSGDGRVVLAAAKRGWRVIGIELNPLLVLVARLRTWQYRRQVRIIWGDYFRVTWPPAEGIFTFMIQRQMSKLDKRIEAWHQKPVNLASLAFHIPGKKPVAKRGGVFLYKYD